MPSKTNFLIVHGSLSNPNANWFPWLKQELEDRGHHVSVPAFPTPENQSLDVWNEIANAAIAGWSPRDTVLIGHSTGSVFVLRMAERATQPFKTVVTVCPFVSHLNIPVYDPLVASFIKAPIVWDKVAAGARKILCYAGDNDPYVPLSLAQEVADGAGIPLNILKKGGHLNAESGYLKFPLLLNTLCEG